jgi:Pyridoxal-dependent decarboxylase conserved domain
VKLSEGYYIMDPVKAVEMVDENTICVAAILGSTLTGEFEDVKTLNDLLTEKNKETGYICFLILSLLNYLIFFKTKIIVKFYSILFKLLPMDAAGTHRSMLTEQVEVSLHHSYTLSWNGISDCHLLKA